MTFTRAMHEPKFIIVGGGLAGALTACYLGKAGYAVEVYEMRDDLRAAEVGGGRSINLALSYRGLCALEPVGLKDEILRMAVPMRGRMIHSPTGELAFQHYGVDDSQAINSVSRGGLNAALLSAAERYPTVKLFFSRKCTDVHLDTAEVDFIDTKAPKSTEATPLNPRSAAADLASLDLLRREEREGGLLRGEEEAIRSIKRVRGDIIVSADGAFSAVRRAMQKQDRFNYSQDYLGHGYKELHIPPGPGSTPESPVFQLEKNALHIWPRRSFMMIALPNADGSFTCTLFWPFEGESSFAAIADERDLLAFFNREFPDAVPLMPTLVEDYFANPVGSLVTIRCSPWHVGGRVVLLGDAAHAVVPFYGQGMNAAFEDVIVLDECIRGIEGRRDTGTKGRGDAGQSFGRKLRDIAHSSSFDDVFHWERAFERFEALRKPNADALADLAVGNFLEMRDKTGSKLFLLKKKGEKVLAKLLPGWYLPLYSMVTFSRIPYAEAVARAKRQNKVLAIAGSVLLLMVIVLWVLLS